MENQTVQNKKGLSGPWKKQCKRLPWLLLIPLGLLLPMVASRHPDFIEAAYSQGIYPAISAMFDFIFQIFPFSFAEILLYVLIVALAGIILFYLIRFLFKRITAVKLVSLFLTLAIIAGGALNAFYFIWGFHYARPKLQQLLGLDVTQREPQELVSLTVSLAAAANQLREQVQEDASGIFTLSVSPAEKFAAIPQAYAALGREIPLFSHKAHTPKPVLASEWMSWAGISGIFIPFTGEANVNVHQPHLLIPVSAAHEAAHGQGIARENEANFVGYLACMASNDAELQYSAVILALINCGNQVYAWDKQTYTEIFQTYSEKVKRDLSAYNAYWKAYEGPVEEMMTQVNDSYLKHNQQQSGVKSYGEMVDLLLAWYAKQAEIEDQSALVE